MLITHKFWKSIKESIGKNSLESILPFCTLVWLIPFKFVVKHYRSELTELPNPTSDRKSFCPHLLKGGDCKCFARFARTPSKAVFVYIPFEPEGPKGKGPLRHLTDEMKLLLHQIFTTDKLTDAQTASSGSSRAPLHNRLCIKGLRRSAPPIPIY